MIQAIFYKNANLLRAFKIIGHSGLSPGGSDILCAAVSAMTALTVNTLNEVYRAKAQVLQNEQKAQVCLMLCPDGEDNLCGILEGFYLQLSDLQKQYPRNIKVRLEDISKY